MSSAYYYKDWIKELKERGIKNFTFRDLPEDLKIRGMIVRCHYAGLIKKSGHKGRCNVWEII